MSDIRLWVSRLRGMFSKRHNDDELSEEIQTHLDALIEDYVRRGQSLAQARLAARREFGSLQQIQETYRDQRGLPLFDDCIQDVRFAARSFARSPGLSVVVVLTLALGIGATTAAFSVLNAVIFRPLPVPRPEQLFVLEGTTPGAVSQRFSYAMFDRLRAATPQSARIAATSRVALMFASVGGAAPERIRVQLVSGDYFGVVGVTATAGRLFTSADDTVGGGHPVAIVSDRWWRRRLNAAPDALGRTLLVNGASVTVVGIAPPGFDGTWVDAPADLFVPLTMQHDLRYAQNYSAHGGDDTKAWVTQEDIEWLHVIGRTANSDRAATGAALKLAYQQGVARQVGDSSTRAFLLQQRITLDPFTTGASSQRARLTTPLVALLAMVLLVLLIACANTANLLLARASARRREIAIRLSMGASRGRLVRQLLTESTVLAAAATGSGVVIARLLGGELMARMTSSSAAPALLDARVLAFTGAVSVATAVLFGVLPAFRTVDVGVADSLRVDTRTMAAGGSRFATRQALVAGQVSLSLVLVVGAALCARSVRHLSHVDLGFDPNHVVSVAMNTRAAPYETRDLPALHARLVERVESLPGVRSAAVAECQLVSGCRNSSIIRVAGYDPRPGERLSIQEYHVGPRYFSTVGIPLIEGRDLDPRDRAPCDHPSAGCDAPAAAIVNRAMAAQFFPGRSAVGQRFGYESQEIAIVGVVDDARVISVQEPPTPMAFYPLLRADVHAAAFEVSTVNDPTELVNAVRKALVDVEPSLPVLSVMLLSERVGRSIDSERFVAVLTAGFGALALGLASFGLFGVMSYTVARRTTELGVRLALGAPPIRVLWMVFRESLLVVAIGICAGLPMVLAGSRAIAGMLVGLVAADVGTVAGSGAVLLVVAGVAGFLPAWRASRLDPIVALRHE